MEKQNLQRLRMKSSVFVENFVTVENNNYKLKQELTFVFERNPSCSECLYGLFADQILAVFLALGVK